MHYPRHIAIIPDWNRTWATERGLMSVQGHIEGKKRTKELLDFIIQTPIEIVTIRWLSTENALQRSQDEKDALYMLFRQAVEEIIPTLEEQKINFKRAGSPEWLPTELVELFRTTEQTYKYDSQKCIVVAVNYWWRDEIIRAVQARQDGPRHDEHLTQELLSSYMDFWSFPPVELVIRTKGDEASRISGFMSWRIGYAELFFTPIKFPDFDVVQLQIVLEWFDGIAQKRNFGK